MPNWHAINACLIENQPESDTENSDELNPNDRLGIIGIIV